MRTVPTALAAIALALIGFLSHWLILFLGICVALVFGNYVTALMLAIAADLLFGPPIGLLHAVPLPFTFFTLIVLVLRVVFLPFIRTRAPTTL